MLKIPCRIGAWVLIRSGLTALLLAMPFTYAVLAGADELDKDTLKLLLWQAPTTVRAEEGPRILEGAPRTVGAFVR